LNPVLRGWGQYFAVGNSKRKFAAVDRYVYLRLAIFLRRKRQRSNLSWSGPELLQQVKALGLYRLVGTVSYAKRAHAVQGSAPESRVRETLMHGSMGGGWKRSSALWRRAEPLRGKPQELAAGPTGALPPRQSPTLPTPQELSKPGASQA